MVWEVSGYHTVSDWAPDGSALIVSRHHSNLNNDLYRLDLETGEASCSRRTRATPGSPAPASRRTGGSTSPPTATGTS